MSELTLKKRLDKLIEYMENHPQEVRFLQTLTYLYDLKNDDLPEWVTQ